MLSRIPRSLLPLLWVSVFVTLVFALVSLPVHAQDDGSPSSGTQSKYERHGRKYKAPPQTSIIEVTVVKGFNKKPIVNAAVIFHPVDADGKDEGFLEMKTDPDGKAKIDVIPTGSSVRVQVIATGYATYAEDYQINEPNREIAISMQRPREQVSTYVDESGKASTAKAGVQEPVRPKLDKNGNPIPQTPAPGSGANPSQPNVQNSTAPFSGTKQQ
jgi:hypothetical protein